MIVNFTKMHGLGNDFVIIDLITQSARINNRHIRKIASRRTGIGCDQVILVSPPKRADADFYYQIFNADGSEAEQCGNGVRCAARFMHDNALTNSSVLSADCKGGSSKLEILETGLISAELMINSLDIQHLPEDIYQLNVGNEHGVLIVEDIAKTPWKKLGAKYSRHKSFKNGANISFMQIDNRNTARLAVYERGVGPSPACGSAACAAVAVGNHLNLLESEATIKFKNGDLLIKVNKQNNIIKMTGPTATVYVGRFKL